MAELNDTYVVHTAMIRCSMGMRETYLVLDDTHGVFLRQQPTDDRGRQCRRGERALLWWLLQHGKSEYESGG